MAGYIPSVTLWPAIAALPSAQATKELMKMQLIKEVKSVPWAAAIVAISFGYDFQFMAEAVQRRMKSWTHTNTSSSNSHQNTQNDARHFIDTHGFGLQKVILPKLDQ